MWLTGVKQRSHARLWKKWRVKHMSKAKKRAGREKRDRRASKGAMKEREGSHRVRNHTCRSSHERPGSVAGCGDAGAGLRQMRSARSRRPAYERMSDDDYGSFLESEGEEVTIPDGIVRGHARLHCARPFLRQQTTTGASRSRRRGGARRSVVVCRS